MFASTVVAVHCFRLNFCCENFIRYDGGAFDRLLGATPCLGAELDFLIHRHWRGCCSMDASGTH